MKNSARVLLIPLTVLVWSASPLAAQWRGEARGWWVRGGAGGTATTPGEAAPLRLPPVSLGVAKWTTLFAAAGLAAYGFELNGEADRVYAELEEKCAARPGRCAARHADGSFVDQELEDQYQRVLRLDRRARVALVAGQLGLAASVVLFVLDIDAEGKPPDIPYVPLRLASRADGVSLQVRVPVR